MGNATSTNTNSENNDSAFTDKDQKSFDFASGVVKQQITLSTGILTVMVAVTKIFFDNLKSIDYIFLIISWILFLFSIVMGCLSLMALTYQLTKKKPSIAGMGVRIIAISQSVCFIFGIILTISFGISTAFPSEGEEEKMFTNADEIVNALPKELSGNKFVIEFSNVLSKWNNKKLVFPSKKQLRYDFKQRLDFASSKMFYGYESGKWAEERLKKFDNLPEQLVPEKQFTNLAIKTMIWVYSTNLTGFSPKFQAGYSFEQNPLPYYLLFAEAQKSVKNTDSVYISASQVVSAAFSWWTNIWPFCAPTPER